MPYIKDENGRRKELREGVIAQTAGELNFKIFAYLKYNTALSLVNKNYIVKQFVIEFLGKKPNYQKYNDMTGCLIRCAKEVQRRLKQDASFLLKIMISYDEEIVKYEDKKILENGDV